jgi:hypothetical protein
VLYTNGDLSLSGGSTDGKGILIATGDLTISGSCRWDGIVLGRSPRTATTLSWAR